MECPRTSTAVFPKIECRAFILVPVIPRMGDTLKSDSVVRFSGYSHKKCGYAIADVASVAAGCGERRVLNVDRRVLGQRIAEFLPPNLRCNRLGHDSRHFVMYSGPCEFKIIICLQSF